MDGHHESPEGSREVPLISDWVLDNPGSLIRRAHQIATSIFLEECGANLTPLQYVILWRVEHNRGIDQTTLARSVALDRTTTAKIVLHLERRKLLRRRTDARDRRTKRLTITPEGAALVEAANAAVERARARVVAPLPIEEQAEFLRLLSKLVNANNAFSRAPLGTEALQRLAAAASEPAAARPGARRR